MEDEINPSKDLGYWVGVVQSDGWLSKTRRKNHGINYLIKLGVITSIPMLEKFREISRKVFNKNNKSWKNKKTGYVEFKFGAKKLLPIFDKLNIDFSDPPNPPNWCLKNIEYFGAYLAGVIDGDGDVRIKRPKYPQCAIRISSGSPQLNLQKAINQILNCSSNIIMVRKIRTLGKYTFLSTVYVLEFNVSRKNMDFIEVYVVPHLAMKHKKNKILSYIKMKGRGRELNPSQKLHKLMC